MPEKPNKKPFDPEAFMRGISRVESSGGQFMKNPTSSASGLYQQLYNSIDPVFLKERGIRDRDAFIADTAAQNAYMRKRIYGDMSNTPRKTNLIKDALDLTREYSPQLGDKFKFRPDEIAALSHFLGRNGARKYLASIRDNKNYAPPGVNKSPEEYLELYNSEFNKDTTLPGRASFGLENGGIIMAKKDKQRVGIKDGQFKTAYDPGTPLHSVFNVPSNATGNFKLSSMAATRDALNRHRWANFHGKMVDYPKGEAVPSFHYSPEMEAELQRRGKSREYIESYQPTNYAETISPDQIPELGLGDFIKENPQGVIGGLKTAAGIGAMFIPGMQGMGAGLIGGGLGDIGKEMARDKLESQQEGIEEDLLAGNQASDFKRLKNQQLQNIANQNTNLKPTQLAYGGPIPYSGQTHDGPTQGIPVDKNGSPSASSNQKPVALTEDGEVAWKTPEGETYVFSKKTGAADKANRIFKKAEARLGKNFTNPDPITKEGMQRSLTQLIASEEAKKSCGGKLKMAKGGTLPQYGKGDFLEDDPQVSDFAGAGVGNTLATGDGSTPWSPFPGQALISGVSGGLGALGNVLLAKTRKRPEDIKATQVTAPRISNVEQRLQTDVEAAEARAGARRGARAAGLSKPQEQAVAASASADIMGKAGALKADSLMKERNINRQSQFQAQLANQQAIDRARQLNAVRNDQFNRETTGIYSQAIGNVTGAFGDIGRAYQDSQYLKALARRSGYQLMKDADGNVSLQPIPGY